MYRQRHRTTLGEDTAQKKSIEEGGNTAYILLMRGTIGMGTSHNIDTETKLGGHFGSVRVCSFRK